MVTQEQIARKLGISRQLVTFALAGYPQVSEKSRKRILAAAEELGYRPNPHARALKNGRTGIIALWIPDQISSHYTHVARELNHQVKAAANELIVTEVDTGGAGQILSHVPVDGIVAVDAPEQVLAHLQSVNKSIPIISIGADCCEAVDFVKVDLQAGSFKLMEHLISSGFRRIAHATFVRREPPEAGRRLAYAKAMREAGLKTEYIYYPLSEGQRAIARQLIQEYVNKKGSPEAIFCHSDDVAIGIYRGLCDIKLRVPADVALAGCDGIPDTEYLECPLTTLVQPVNQMCATAWRFLEQRLKCLSLAHQQEVLQAELVIRQSSARNPGLKLA